MATCPNGHSSGADDWCEVCGIRMTGPAPMPAGGPPPPTAAGYGYPGPAGGDPTQQAELCPECNTPREGMAAFCEECRYNFLTRSPSPYQYPASTGTVMPPGPRNPQGMPYTPSGSSQINRGSEPLGPDTGRLSAPLSAPMPDSMSGGGQRDPRMPLGDFELQPPSQASYPGGQQHQHQQSTGWVAVVSPDREYFTAMMQRSGPDAHGLNLPAYSPEQKVVLTGREITIGRRRQSTGESPDIDMARPPEDPGVSHRHAVLVQQQDGGWAVVDQNSTNGTTVNGGVDPIQPFVPVPLQEGDRVHIGAWTTIRLQRG